MNDNTDDMSGHVATGREETRQGRDMSRYTLTVDQVAKQFDDANLAVSESTVQRYCSSGKLDCIKIDPDTRQPTEKNAYTFLIDPTSLTKRMEKLREKREFIRTTVDPSAPDTPRHDETSRDEARHDASEDLSRVNELEHDNLKLQQENLQLEIDKKGKEYFINQLIKERKETVIQLTEQSRQIGVLETRLTQIEAPREEDEPTDTNTLEPVEPTYIEVKQEKPAAGDEATPATDPIEENPDG